jgi:hypothetical protein
MTEQTNVPKPDQPNAMRRRIAKGGLAAPVVLASLVSKPVLADFNILGGGPPPYNCTISGQLSGNTSSHGVESCSGLQKSAALVAADYPYPLGPPAIVTALSYLIDYTDAGGTTFPGLFPNLPKNYFFISGTGTDGSGHVTGGILSFSSGGIQPGGSVPASINQILHLPAPAGSEYAVKALVLLLNAKGLSDTSTYPIIQSQAERLYVAAATGGGFTDTNPTVNWTNAEVHSYIDLLYY